MKSYIQKIWKSIVNQYHELDGVFTEREAWVLFRSAAIIETVGWTLLITGITFKILRLPAYDYVLPIAGSVHGIFFIYYILIVFFVHRSLNWGLWRFAIAEALANVPAGALVFELWESRRRKKAQKKLVH